MRALIDLCLIGFAAAQFTAFAAGLEDWLGLHWVVAGLGAATLLSVFGTIGAVWVSIIAFYGCIDTLGWSVWAAGALGLPSLIVGLPILTFSHDLSLTRSLMGHIKAPQTSNGSIAALSRLVSAL